MRRVHFFRAGSTRKGQAVVVKPLKRQQPRSARRILKMSGRAWPTPSPPWWNYCR